MRHEIPHDLELPTAKLAARKAVESYAIEFDKYGFKSVWTTDTNVEISFSIKGMRLGGTFSVHPDKLLLELDVPLLFRVFIGRAVTVIDKEGKKWLAKAKRGELDGGGENS